mmetsp:Transcript_3772/g.9457  ORF Transcript_3772/g.9457 Transcript_3772/m.9457 type:complete len:82 (+) Transcript_3772:518-763(+)
MEFRRPCGRARTLPPTTRKPEAEPTFEFFKKDKPPSLCDLFILLPPAASPQKEGERPSGGGECGGGERRSLLCTARLGWVA